MGRMILRSWCFVMAMAVAATVATAGRLELRNEISGVVRGGRRGKLAVRCWSDRDDLGWDIISPGDSRTWQFTTINCWPFPTTVFRCEFRSPFGTTKEDVVTVFSGYRDFQRENCDVSNGKCVWVVKRKGLFHRRVVKGENGKTSFDDVAVSPWVWKW